MAQLGFSFAATKSTPTTSGLSMYWDAGGMRMLKLIAVVVALVSTPFARADCAAQSAATRPHLIELFSSDGCSSCPPAEAWLRSVRNDARTVALEFHVDYWDALGWRDRFASARYTARQQAFATRTGGAGVYTPEVILDGREWRDWYRRPEVPAANGKATMKLSVEPGTPLHVHVDTIMNEAADASPYANYVALVEDGLSSQVHAGENRGTLLRHDHVVREFVGPLAQADIDLSVPADVDQSHATVVAFAQRVRDGDVAQVVMLPLAQCQH
jgi:hypothetical protein